MSFNYQDQGGQGGQYNQGGQGGGFEGRHRREEYGQQGGQYGQNQNFDPNAYQQYLNAYNNGGNFEQMPPQQVYNHYQQMAQQVPPDQMYQAQHQYYQQMPQEQRQGLFGSLMNAFQQNGVNPQQAGIVGNEPSPQNLANATQYATQNPNMMQNIFGNGGILSNPIAKVALAGGLALAAKNFLGGGGLGNIGGGGGII